VSAPSAAERAVEPAPPGPPPPDAVRAQLRLAVGVGQLAYGVLRLRRSKAGWYHLVLGGRQVVQSRFDAAGLLSPVADSAIDSLHVATMLAVALLRPSRRRTALLGAAHAAAWAGLDLAFTRGVPAIPPEVLAKIHA
jgi:hypothetical protein